MAQISQPDPSPKNAAHFSTLPQGEGGLSLYPAVQHLLNLRAEGRAQHRGHVGLGLREHALGVAEGLEAVDAVIRAHARRADPTERQILHRDMHDHVVDGHAARGRVGQHAFLFGAVGAEVDEFIAFVAKLQGDEKGESQLFLDHLFRAFGHAGVIEIGGQLEYRVRWNNTTKFADLVWPKRVLIEMKKRGESAYRALATPALAVFSVGDPRRPLWRLLRPLRRPAVPAMSA